MVRDYELMYIVRPDVDEDGLRAAVDSVKTLIEGQGGEITKTTNWGKRRLAYEVKHLRDGHYVIVEMKLDGARVAEVERALRIHDAVFRHLLVVQEVPGGEGTELEDAEGAISLSAPPPEPELDGEAEAADETELDEAELVGAVAADDSDEEE